jgi:hypothetical protein
MSIMTSVRGIVGVLGPTLGGLITDTPRLTWRFCFWINHRELWDACACSWGKIRGTGGINSVWRSCSGCDVLCS